MTQIETAKKILIKINLDYYYYYYTIIYYKNVYNIMNLSRLFAFIIYTYVFFLTNQYSFHKILIKN